MGIGKTFKDIPIIESDRILLRAFSEADGPDVFEYASDPEVTNFLPWEKHADIKSSLEFIRKTRESIFKTDNVDFAIEFKSDKKVIGGIGIRDWNNKNLCADAGYVVSRKYWGRGIATEALIMIIKFGFEILGVNRIEAHCDENNTASYKVMEKAGMTYEGTLRKKIFLKNKFVSMRFYSILKEEYIGNKFFENFRTDFEGADL